MVVLGEFSALMEMNDYVYFSHPVYEVIIYTLIVFI